AVDESLEEAASTLASTIADEYVSDAEGRDEEDGDRSPDGAVTEAVDDVRLGTGRFAVFDDDGRLVAATDGAATIAKDAPPTAEVVSVAKAHGGALTTFSDGGAGTRAFALRQAAGGTGYTIVVIHNLDREVAWLAEVRKGYSLAIPVALLGAAIGGGLLA